MLLIRDVCFQLADLSPDDQLAHYFVVISTSVSNPYRSVFR